MIGHFSSKRIRVKHDQYIHTTENKYKSKSNLKQPCTYLLGLRKCFFFNYIFKNPFHILNQKNFSLFLKAAEQLSLCATTTEPMLQSPRATTTELVCHNY